MPATTSGVDAGAAVGLGSLHEPTPDAASRPTDEDILAQENMIRMAEASRVNYIGDLEGMTALYSEYERGSAVFRRKIESLSATYSHMRRTRGDGNCFFRGFCFAYLEYLSVSGDEEERERFRGVMSRSADMLEQGGFDRIVFEDALDVLTDLAGTREQSPSVEEILLSMRDEGTSQMLVMLLRFVTSAEIQRRTDFFAPFVLGMTDMTVGEFCNKSVVVMGEESDHIHIVALSDALGVPLRVMYLDGSPAGFDGAVDAEAGTVPHHDFVPEGCSKEPLFTLLYRPGHYDILYQGAK